VNERLRQALNKAGLDIDDLARATGATHETAGRWIKPGRTPQRRYRIPVVRLLKCDEADLWPELASPGSDNATAEIVNAYAHRVDVPAELWWQLLCNAKAHVDLLGYALLHLPENHPRLVDLLRGKAAAGCAIQNRRRRPRQRVRCRSGQGGAPRGDTRREDSHLASLPRTALRLRRRRAPIPRYADVQLGVPL